MLSYFENFKKYAFRLELLQKYSIREELEDFSNFLKTGEIDSGKNSDWHNLISKAKSRGAIMNRVHVVDFPYSDYLKYEFEAYKFNELAGEDIYLLDKKYFDSDINYDFWLFDDEVVLKMNYGAEGNFLGIEEIKVDIKKYINLKNNLLSVSKNFKLFEK